MIYYIYNSGLNPPHADMALKTFPDIELSVQSPGKVMARKGHGSHLRPLAGGFVYPRQHRERSRMRNGNSDEQLSQIVTATELSLAWIAVYYYYTVQLPEQQKHLKK